MFGVDSYVPVLTNNFEIRIYGMDGANPAQNSDLLTLSTAEIGDIVEEQDAIIVHYGNGTIKFPSKVTFSDLDWTLNCFCEPNVLDGLIDWRKQVYDPETEKMGIPSQYMRTAYFIRYDGQGNPKTILKAPGVWVRGLDYGSMNQEGGALVQVKTTLVVSKVIPLKASDFR